MLLESIKTASDIASSGLVLPKEGACFHCGEPLPKVPFVARVLDADRQMCCLGCQLAAQSIVEAGLEQYYLDRQKISRNAPLPDALMIEAYNHDDIKQEFVYEDGGHLVAQLSVVGLRCAACAWLIERRLYKLDGVVRCDVNLTNQRMQVMWDDTAVQIGTILQAISQIGYDAKPYRSDTHEAALKRANKQMLIRLGVAAIGAMQAMMFSIGLYFGVYSGMADEHREFLRFVSMIVSIPVVFYAGMPFFLSAKSALRTRQINMDVPVSIALLLTFFASSYATFSNGGETYFDSVAMFVFFLLAGRYVEQNARLKAANIANDLIVVQPSLVQKIGEDKAFAEQLIDDFEQNNELKQKIAQFFAKLNTQAPSDVHKVMAGDVVVVPAGGQILADGVLLSDAAKVSQSLLTGESDLIAKTQGDYLFGGSQNDSTPLVMLAIKDTANSQMALIDRLINRAMNEKPKIAVQADKMARWFVARVLVLAVIVFFVWWWIDSSKALWATVAVLVATCPCALSLATPIALTVSTNTLAKKGFLVTRGHTIEALSAIDTVCFDKTGTLTVGMPSLIDVQIFTQTDKQTVLSLAGALEKSSTHPIAKSILRSANHLHLPVVENLQLVAGGGVVGVIDGVHYRLGHERFALGEAYHEHGAVVDLSYHKANMAVVLSIKDGERYRPMACLYFNDVLRQGADSLINYLKRNNITPIIVTGDPGEAGRVLGDKFGISAHTALLPEDKVAIIQNLQREGNKVLMMGDGVNDAPVLAVADVSVAIANGSDLAQVHADAVMFSDELTAVQSAMTIGHKTQHIIRQNLRWAFIYNTAILIPAAAGYVPPWAAAIGMSLSSLLVVLNALRIRRI